MTAAPAKTDPKADLGALPNWNLTDLYARPDAPEIERDLKSLAALSGEFKRNYEGKLAGLSGAALLEALLAYERMQDLAGRVGSYAQLAYAGNMTDPTLAKFQQSMSERLNAIGVETLIFTLELNKIEDATLAKQLTHQPLQRYQPWLEAVRSFRPHQLSDEAERLLHEKSISGRQAWNRMFDETMAEMRFEVEGESDKLSSNQVLNLLTDRDGKKRKAAAMGLAKGLKDQQRTFALVTNTLQGQGDRGQVAEVRAPGLLA